MSKVVEQLKQIQADAHVLSVQFHNYHWNVKGLQFKAIHLYTEKAYEDVLEIFDDAAERILQLDGRPLVCPKVLLETAKAPSVRQDCFEAKEVVSFLKKDYEYLLEQFKKLADLADEVDDRGTVSICDGYIAKYEKEIWMLKSTLGLVC